MDKNLIQKLISECNELYNTTSEYGIGYLDCLTSLCEELKIKHTRTEDNLLLTDRKE